VEEILRAREEAGFNSIDDFARRVSPSKVNRKAWDALAKSGAFDQLADRSDVLFNLDNLLSFASKLHKEALSGQVNLFGNDVTSSVSNIKLAAAPEPHSPRERLIWERELLGLYLSSHPLDPYDSYLSEQTVALDKITQGHSGKTVTIGGLVGVVRRIVTKNGGKMAFVSIEDKTSTGEIIVFPKLFNDVAEQLTQDAIIKVKGKASFQDKSGQVTDELKVIADELIIVSVEELENYKSTGKKLSTPKPSVASKINAPVMNQPISQPIINEPSNKTLYIHIKDPDDHDRLLKMKKTLNNYPGSQSVVLVLGEAKQSALRLPFKVGASSDLTTELTQLYSPECVVIK
jgi:DNA polymerase-3 subunit alpha